MSRLDEVTDVNNTMSKTIRKINESDIELDAEQVRNLIFTSISQQLTEISVSLAIIADKLGGE